MSINMLFYLIYHLKSKEAMMIKAMMMVEMLKLSHFRPSLQYLFFFFFLYSHFRILWSTSLHVDVYYAYVVFLISCLRLAMFLYYLSPQCKSLYFFFLTFFSFDKRGSNIIFLNEIVYANETVRKNNTFYML